MIQALDVAGYTKENRWCGPSAVSLLTGAPLAYTTSRLAVIGECTYEEMEGAYTEALILLLGELGKKVRRAKDFMTRYSDTEYGPTLRRFMRTRTREEQVTKLLITLDRHFVVAHGSLVFDNGIPRGAPIEAFPKPNRLVKMAYLVTP